MTEKQSTTLDDLLSNLYCVLDDLSPEPPQRLGRPRETTDTEMVCMAVAQVLLDCPAERVWMRRMPWRLGHLFHHMPSRVHYNRRLRALRARLLEALDILRQMHPETLDDMLLTDSTPVPAGRSLRAVRHSAMADIATYGYCASHSRYYWGFKLIILTSSDGFPVAFELVPANVGEVDALRTILPRTDVRGRSILGDKGFTSKDLEDEIKALGGSVFRPDKKNEKRRFGSLAAIRQWIESVFATLKGQLSLERHGGRTYDGLTVRVLQRLLALSAALWNNARCGHPGRNLVNYGY